MDRDAYRLVLRPFVAAYAAMMSATVQWVVRQFGTRKTAAECVAIASAMLDVYYSDPSYYSGATFWRLYEASLAHAKL